MTEFFRPYEGQKPYIFVSYSHRDSEKVLDTIRPIHEKHYRLWYDEGIPAGSDWPRNIAEHMRDCRMVLFFLSRTALESPNCLSEITTAARQKKTILLLPLEEIPESGMSSAWQDCLREAVRIAPDDLASGRTENILRAPQMTELFLGTEDDFRRDGRGGEGRAVAGTVAVILAALLLALSLSSVWGLSTGRIKVFETPTPTPTATPTPTPSPTPTPTPTPSPTPTPEPTPTPTPTPTPSPTPAPTPTPTPTPTPSPTPTPVPTPEPTAYIPGGAEFFRQYIEFPDSQQERAIRRALEAAEGDIPKERLLEITELYFVGRMIPRSLEGVEIRPDGTVTVNGPEVSEGSVKNLKLISIMPYLSRLALIAQPVTSLAPLNGLVLLQEVNAASSSVSDVEGLAELPSLQVLNISHTAVKDLTPLKDLPMLRKVIVSLDMLPMTLDAEAYYEVFVVP